MVSIDEKVMVSYVGKVLFVPNTWIQAPDEGANVAYHAGREVIFFRVEPAGVLRGKPEFYYGGKTYQVLPDGPNKEIGYFTNR